MVRIGLSQCGGFWGRGDVYNVLISVHALLIIFFIIIPILIGVFGNWIIPLLEGVVDLLYPRINNLSA